MQGEPRIVLGTASDHAFVSAWLTTTSGTPLDLAVYRAQRPQDAAGELGFISAAFGGAATAPQWRDLHVTAEHRGPNPPPGGTMTHKVGHLYFPPMAETLAYDADGNLTDDARWHYTWDAENRLKGMETQLTAANVGVPRQRLSFTYDGQSRRVRKVVESYSAASQTWSVTSDRRFVYDDWNMIAEFNFIPQTSSFILFRSYAWGLDLSGTLQGAGGVGGLVSVTEYDANGTATRMLAPAYDTNGNIMAYADIATGAVTHRFEYDAFGIALTMTSDGDATEPPPFRFSTKYLDGETGLYYYGFRYYSPELGRWLSRDPIGERGGVNLYGMVGNDPINSIDPRGHDRWIVGDGHTSLYVDEYDKDGKKTCFFTRIDFGPKLDSGRNGGQLALYVILKRALSGAGTRGAYGAALSLAVLEGKIYVTPNQQMPLGLPDMKGSVIKSNKQQDEQLLKLIDELKKDVMDYNTLFFNCRHFVRTVAQYPMQDIPGFTINPVPMTTTGATTVRFLRQEGKYAIFVDDQGNEYPVWGTMQIPNFDEPFPWPIY